MAKKKAPPKHLVKRDETLSLTLPDRFFIEQHGNMSQEELATTLNKPIELVREYVLKLAATYEKKKKSRVRTLMDRPGKHGGVVAMTEAASMVGDENSKKYVTLDSIHRAMAEGNDELVRDLKKRYDEQERVNKRLIRSKYGDMIHYIEPPDDDEVD